MITEPSLGPYMYDTEPGCKNIYTLEGNRIACTDGVSEPEDEANARMFAKSWEMYQYMLGWCTMIEENAKMLASGLSPHHLKIANPTYKLFKEIVDYIETGAE